MKKLLFALSITSLLFSCKPAQNEKVLIPKILSANGIFNGESSGKTDVINILDYKTGKELLTGDDPDTSKSYTLKYKDSVLSIQTDPADPKSASKQFASARYVNSKKTTLLVQLKDQSGLTAPCYILSLDNKKIDAISLYRPSKGAQDRKYTNGIISVNRDGYVVNNDFFVTNVKTRVYLIKRQNEAERIQGDFFLKSFDKETLVFLMPHSLYQVHYPTGLSNVIPLGADLPATLTGIQVWVSNNYSWHKTGKGISFLQKNPNENRIIDLKDL